MAEVVRTGVRHKSYCEMDETKVKYSMRTKSLLTLRMLLVAGLLGMAGISDARIALGATAGLCQQFLSRGIVHSVVNGVKLPSAANCSPVTLLGRSSVLTSPRALAVTQDVSIRHNYPALHPDLYTPPDTQGAAGPSIYIETVNQTIAVYSPKLTGASVITATLDTFFSSLA